MLCPVPMLNRRVLASRRCAVSVCCDMLCPVPMLNRRPLWRACNPMLRPIWDFRPSAPASLRPGGRSPRRQRPRPASWPTAAVGCGRQSGKTWTRSRVLACVASLSGLSLPRGALPPTPRGARVSRRGSVLGVRVGEVRGFFSPWTRSTQSWFNDV